MVTGSALKPKNRDSKTRPTSPRASRRSSNKNNLVKLGILVSFSCALKVHVLFYSDMITQIEVKKNGTENNANLLRRFTRRVQESGMVFKIKNNRYNERKESKLKTKNQALRRLERRTIYERQKKLGKVS